MPWRRYAVSGRHTITRCVATCQEPIGTLDVQCIRRYYHPHQQHTMLNSQMNVVHPIFSRRRKYLYTKTPMASLSSPSFSSSSSDGSTGNLEDDSTTSTLPSSSFHNATNTDDTSMIALHMQRMQQHELRRNYKRQQQRKRSTNTTISSNSNRHNKTIPANQQLPALSSGKNQAVMEQDNRSINNTTNATAGIFREMTPNLATPDEVRFILNELHQRLAQILQEVLIEDSGSRGSGSIDDAARRPLWEIARQQQDQSLDQHDEEDYTAMLEHHGDLFQRTVAIHTTLNNYVGPDKIIRPGTLHRHEFVALVGLILQIYSHLPANVSILSETSTDSSDTSTTTTTPTPTITRSMTLLTQTLELIDWIRGPPYRFELSHKQCHSVITVAAKCQQWDLAAQIYMEHIDPDKAGYIPVPIHTISARSFTMDGLFCIAHAAILNQTLPVENVFDGVTKLMMVSPTDTESCTFALFSLFASTSIKMISNSLNLTYDRCIIRGSGTGTRRRMGCVTRLS